MNRRQVVQILDDHTRIEKRAAVIGQQAGDLAQRIEFLEPGFGRKDVFELVLIVDFLFRQDDFYLADVGTGVRAEKLHVQLPGIQVD